MSEIWNADSAIEEKKSLVVTPQLSQLKTRFSIRDIHSIIKKYQNNGQIEDYDYHLLVWFIDSEYSVNYTELSDYVKTLFGDKLKDEYFKVKLNQNKEKLQSYAYSLIYNFFIEDKLDQDKIESLRNELYKAMTKIPELFNSDMLSKKYREKIAHLLPEEEIKKRDIESTKLNDQETHASDILYQKKLTNEALKNEILKDIPPHYSDLQKSIYIYIKLCQHLSYDFNYYANRKSFNGIHQEFSNIARIGTQTNNVICYEFVTIYSEMLKDMGIKVAATTKLDMGIDNNDEIIYTNFDDSHSNLKYTVDNIVVFADSTLSVLNGDLINAKMNSPLNGLQCLSVNQAAKDKFNDALQSVYKDMQYNNVNFKKYSDEIKEKNLVDRLKILFDDISSANFNPTDFISYITSIKHELFTDDELDWNLKISYIGKNANENQYPVTLFSVNTNDIRNVQQDTVQYLYDAVEKRLSKLDKKGIEEMFRNGELFFIDENINIPNINTDGKSK